jgi:hypothetical protein
MTWYKAKHVGDTVNKITTSIVHVYLMVTQYEPKHVGGTLI